MATTKEEAFELLSILNQTRRQIEQFRAAASSAERLEKARVIRRTAEEYRRRSEQLLAAVHASTAESASVSAAVHAEDQGTFSERGAVTRTGGTRDSAEHISSTVGEIRPPDRIEQA